MPSQVLPQPPYLFGPLAAEAARARPSRLRMELFPAEPVAGEGGMPHAEPPAASWTCEPGGASGPLSIMSFVALWAQQVRSVAGIPLELSIHDAGSLAACPFAAPHPSGFFQAIQYDGESQSFHRQVLYPVD